MQKQQSLVIIIIISIAAVTAAATQDDDVYCFGKDAERPQTRHFTSKTAYQIVKGTHMEKQHQVPGCIAEKIWILHRHGTRLPSGKFIRNVKRLEQLRDDIVQNYKVSRPRPAARALCQEDFVALLMWKWNASITEDQEDYLTSQGYEDLRGTAKLYQKLYPDLLPKHYDAAHYLLRHTATQRTAESLKAFAEGLFGAGNAPTGETVPEPDLLLRPYEHCDTWTAHEAEVDAMVAAYRKTTMWQETVANISRRLGFLSARDDNDIELMYDMCRYEQAWHVDRTSVWCSAFLREHVSVLEYDDDLKYYYKSGYGYEENERINCRVVKDMLVRLSGQTDPRAIVYVAHSTTIQTFLTALGINRDNMKLTASNYDQMADRKWRTSDMDPFASNFVAVKYYCHDDPVDNEKAVFFLNQRAIIDLDWCKVGLCNWSDVLAKYKTLHAANCDDIYCRAGSATLTHYSMTSLLIVAVGLFIFFA